MKFLKKTMAAVLGLTMAFSFSACSLSDLLGVGGGDKSSSDGWENSSPDSPIEIIGEGAKYIEGIVETIRESKTISMDVSFVYDHENVDKMYGKEIYDEETGESYIEEWNGTYDEETSFDMTIIAAKVADSYNVSVSGTLHETYTYFNHEYDENVEKYVASEVTEEMDTEFEMLLVGDMAYVKEDGQWYKTPIDWEELQYELGIYDTESMSMIAVLYDTLMEGDFSEAYGILGPIFEQTLTLDLQTQTHNFELDLADDITSLIDYISNLDYSQTVTAYLNSVLAESDTSVEEILNDIAAKGTMTVQEVYNELNKAVMEETGKDFNGIKNALLAEIDMEQLGYYIDEESFAELQEMYNMMVETDVETMLAPYMDYTMDQLISMVYGEDGSTDITLALLKDQILDMLNNMTLDEMFEQFAGEELSSYVEELQGLTLNALKETASLKFNGYEISQMQSNFIFDFAYEDEYYLESMSVNFEMSMEFSKNETVIEAPKDAIDMPEEEEYYACYFCGSEDVVFSEDDCHFCEECYNYYFAA